MNTISWKTAAMVPVLALFCFVANSATTYTRDVAPIFNAKCVNCHRPNEIAPMSLRTYEEVRPWAKSIQKRVTDKSMPPWHADPAHGTFSNDRSLSSDEINTISTWVKQGAVQGNPADLPKTPTRSTEWREGKPDYILEFGEETIAAGGPDDYRYTYTTFDVPDDKWIRAIELRPSNRNVAHHAVVYYQNESEGRGFLGAWAPGLDAWSFPEGSGRLLKKGARLIMNMHYHPTDQVEVDSTKIALFFCDQKPTKEIFTQFVQNNNFKIPAGAKSHTDSASFTFSQDSLIVGMLPHMHYRGKSMSYVAHYPDGKKETIISIPKYDFNWQTIYVPVEPIRAPKGTRIDVIATWDNSADNPFNPNPAIDVTFGQSSDSEMLIGFVDYVPADNGKGD
jgi:hypothetical protein